MGNANLRVIKLTTGEEIIGTVVDGINEASEDENYTLDNLIFVTNPMKIVSEYDSKSKVHALYLIDWIPSIADNTLPIDKQKILTLGTPNKDLESHYIDIILAQSLLESVYSKEYDESDTEPKTTNKKDTLEKLKKHNFDDDDIQ